MTYKKDINATGRDKKKYDCIYCQRNHVKGIRVSGLWSGMLLNAKEKKLFSHIKKF